MKEKSGQRPQRMLKFLDSTRGYELYIELIDFVDIYMNQNSEINIIWTNEDDTIVK